MAEYIEREAALNFDDSVLLAPGALQPFMDGMAFYADHIKRLPAADVVPVRHGRWESSRPDAPMFGFHFCSLCGRTKTSPQDNYCPNCGAKMDMEAE